MLVTNAVGAVFTAALLSASDSGVTFAFAEDGSTNALLWTQLSRDSQEAVCEAARFSPVPPELAASFLFAQKELARIAALENQNRLSPSDCACRRQAVRELFRMRCHDTSLSEVRIRFLLNRLH